MEYDEQIFNRGGTNYTYLISIIVHCISMLTNVANPILYAWLNPKFKELFIQVFKNARLPDSSDNTRIQREASQKVIVRTTVGTSAVCVVRVGNFLIFPGIYF
jgi:hypothetical protein